MASRQFATFEVADQLFGVEVHTVQEVLSYNEYTPVPLAPPAVGGLFNLRGQVAPPGFAHGAEHYVDHVVLRGLERAGRGRPLERGDLSDHAPLWVEVRDP